jgi:hypothetical protein
MSPFRQHADSRVCKNLHTRGDRNQSGPLSSPERRFGTVADMPRRSARKSSTFGMSRSVASHEDIEAFVRSASACGPISRKHGEELFDEASA